MKEGNGRARALWHGDWRGNPSSVSFTENGTDPQNYDAV